MKDKDVVFVNNGEALTFDAVSGFAINPQNDTAWFGADFRDLLLTVVGTGTVVVYGSNQKVPPDFTATSDIDNSYVAVMTADYTTPNTYNAGGSGVVVAGATKIVEVNTNMLTWIGISRSAETVNVKLTMTNAQ